MQSSCFCGMGFLLKKRKGALCYGQSSLFLPVVFSKKKEETAFFACFVGK
jgi:hypothetical protein